MFTCFSTDKTSKTGGKYGSIELYDGSLDYAAGAGSRAALILFCWDAFILASILNSQQLRLDRFSSRSFCRWFSVPN